LSLPGTST